MFLFEQIAFNVVVEILMRNLDLSHLVSCHFKLEMFKKNIYILKNVGS